jgi:phosphoribosylformylglycinamidine synthase II
VELMAEPGSKSQTSASDETLAQIALSRDEYEQARERLGREPSDVELGMIGALWSEHCGYKHSKPLFRYFPTEGPQILTELGTENAGAVDIGDGWVVVMKVESHNHPSAIEPYEGAATGVGGIVRDIFAMGARPIALLDSLRFGPLDDPHNRHLFSGVVSGIGGYGNCLGIPNVGGEVVFGEGYSGNPLVNAMCVGIAPVGSLVGATTGGPGAVFMVVGADTGKDGLHGATFASVELNEASEERRPAVQVGNPFLEKLLMEACVQLVQEHSDWIEGLQDCGAAGLTSACVESAARGGTGLRLDTDAVPRREAGMTPYDVMLSESQERMVALVKPGHEDDVRKLFERWELTTAIIGESTADGLTRIIGDGEEVAAIDVDLLTGPPSYEGDAWQGEADAALARFDPSTLPDVADANAALLRLLAAPNIADKSWVTQQYDQQVLTNTVLVPGSDAGVVRIKGTQRAIALCTDGNGRAVRLNPHAGAARAVAEAARNVACTGARPLAVTDCLNFGNPERPEIYYQLSQAVQGIGDACRMFETPVVSGNVSLYNETPSGPVTPTPVIGMLGLIEDVTKVVRRGFRDEGDTVFLLGAEVAQEAATLGGSEYLAVEHGHEAGAVEVDLKAELALIRLLTRAAEEELLQSAHDLADGGLAVALVECAIAGEIGLDAPGVEFGSRLDAALFGEAGARAIVSVAPAKVEAVVALAAEAGVRAVDLGRVGGTRLRLGGDVVDCSVENATAAYRETLPRVMDGE